jgi:hypothetical protein
MPLYFLLFDEDRFNELARLLAKGRADRGFSPLQLLRRELRASADQFAERHGMAAGNLLITQVIQGASVDRHLWRTLVGEILLISAAATPEIETAPETLACLLARDRFRDGLAPRERFAPIEQAHFGSRDLVFGDAYYRPEHAGWNNRDDVARLAQYLAGIDPAAWQVSNLDELRDISPEDRADELAYARQSFAVLQDLYRGANERGHVVVCEEI